jgi:hypothetical protein
MIDGLEVAVLHSASLSSLKRPARRAGFWLSLVPLSTEEVRFQADPRDEGFLAESTKPRFGLEARRQTDPRSACKPCDAFAAIVGEDGILMHGRDLANMTAGSWFDFG